jgi:trimethylamine:corrinoid methyltransferase-like protein
LWEKDGSRDIFEVAEEKVLEMLKAEPISPLSPEAESEIDRVAQAAQAG